MKKLAYFLRLVCICLQGYSCTASGDIARDESKDNAITNAEGMKLKITIGDKTATAVLYDNPTSRDFAAMLPLTVKMDDYSNTEKIFYPSRKLSVKDAPKGFDPSVGDITLYAPWGNIALFYKDFSYSNGLISLGKITSGMESFTVKGSITAKFELID